MQRVLLITEDEVLPKTVSLMLGHAKAQVLTVAPGAEALDLVRHGRFDLVILDLPSGERPPAAGDPLRKAADRIPVLVLTSEAHVADESEERFLLGKPFHREDLQARISALLEDRGGRQGEIIRVGEIEIDRALQEARVGGRRVPLTAKEFEVLEYLAVRQGTTLTKDMFLNYLYGGVNEPEMKIIDVFVCKLRKKLSRATGGPHYIETVWGRGYVMRDPDALDEQDRQSAAPA